MIKHKNDTNEIYEFKLKKRVTKFKAVSDRIIFFIKKKF